MSRSRHWPAGREDDIQASLVAHLHWRGVPGLFFFHPANEGRRHPIEGARLKALGLRAGTPDVILIHQGRCFALELKTEAGRVTKAQTATIAALERAGALTAVCRGLDAALHRLEAWGLLRR